MVIIIKIFINYYIYLQANKMFMMEGDSNSSIVVKYDEKEEPVFVNETNSMIFFKFKNLVTGNFLDYDDELQKYLKVYSRFINETETNGTVET